jgi:hypothetical protein
MTHKSIMGRGFQRFLMLPIYGVASMIRLWLANAGRGNNKALEGLPTLRASVTKP